MLENMMSAAPDINATEARKVLGSFLFTGDDAEALRVLPARRSHLARDACRLERQHAAPR
ncbi:MAG: hypothetical protein U0Q04_04210 [Microbacterium sp.]